MREDSPAVTCKSPLLVGSGLSSPFASSPSLYTASLASSCKSVSPGIPQRLRLHLPRTAAPCADPTDSRARSGQLVWRKIGSHKREGGAWAALAAALETILIKSVFHVWIRGDAAWRIWSGESRVAREKLVGLGHGRSIGGGFAPGLPWRRRSKRFASSRVSFFHV